MVIDGRPALPTTASSSNEALPISTLPCAAASCPPELKTSVSYCTRYRSIVSPPSPPTVKLMRIDHSESDEPDGITLFSTDVNCLDNKRTETFLEGSGTLVVPIVGAPQPKTLHLTAWTADGMMSFVAANAGRVV